MLPNSQIAAATAKKGRSDGCIRFILALAFLASAAAHAQAPRDLAKLAALREAENETARSQYTYRQTVTLDEMDSRGTIAGSYHEVRDVIFSPAGERSDRTIGTPRLALKRLALTEEDFRDLREVQPFLFTPDRVWMYETRFRGEEHIDGADCWLLQVRPRQILQGQRLFDGTFWISKQDHSIIRSEGRAVPQIFSTKQENLFPHFTTLRSQIDGKHWFPIYTHADDTLPFRTGPIRIRMKVRYTEYKRFGAESTITFEKHQ